MEGVRSSDYEGVVRGGDGEGGGGVGSVCGGLLCVKTNY